MLDQAADASETAGGSLRIWRLSSADSDFRPHGRCAERSPIALYFLK
jgi:hypothetical protein